MGKRIIAIVLTLVLILGGGTFAYIRFFRTTKAYKDETQFEDMLKIQVYNAADLEIGVYLEDGSIASASQWAYKQLQAVVKQQGSTIGPEYVSPINVALTNNIRDLIASGYVKTDGAGTLSEVSKSYLANAVASAVFSAAPMLRDIEVIPIEYQLYDASISNLESVKSLKEQLVALKKNIERVESGAGMPSKAKTTSAYGKYIVTMGSDGQVTVYNTETQETLEGDFSDVYTALGRPEELDFMASIEDYSAEVNASASENVKTMTYPPYVVTIGKSGDVTVIDSRTGRSYEGSYTEVYEQLGYPTELEFMRNSDAFYNEYNNITNNATNVYGPYVVTNLKNGDVQIINMVTGETVTGNYKEVYTQLGRPGELSFLGSKELFETELGTDGSGAANAALANSEEIKQLTTELEAIQTLITVMETNFNDKVEKYVQDGKLSETMPAEEIAALNVQMVAQFDSIAEIEAKIAEISENTQLDAANVSVAVTEAQQQVDNALATVDSIREQLAQQVADSAESTQLINEVTAGLIQYKAEAAVLSQDIKETIDTLENSITGTMESNYTELREALEHHYEENRASLTDEIAKANETIQKNADQASAELQNNVDRLNALISENETNINKELTNSVADLTATIDENNKKSSESLAEASQKLTDTINLNKSQTDEALAAETARSTAALEAATLQLRNQITQNQGNINQDLDDYKGQVSDTFDAVNARIAALEQRFGTATATTTQLISSIVTQAGTLDTTALSASVTNNVEQLTDQIEASTTDLTALYTSVNGTAASTARSRTKKTEVLAEINTLLTSMANAQRAVDEYGTNMQARIATIDMDIINAIQNVSNEEADVQALLLQAADALLSLQQAERTYASSLKSRVGILLDDVTTATQNVEDFGTLVKLDADVDTLVTSINDNVSTLNTQLTTLTNNTQSAIDTLNDTLTDLINTEVTALSDRVEVLETSVRLFNIDSFTIAPDDWTAASATSYTYAFTNAEISPVLIGDYEVQVAVHYAQGVAITPSYGVVTENGVAYIQIAVTRRPATNVVVENVTIYYKPLLTP